MSTIWRKSDDGWNRLEPSGFPLEAALHDLVETGPEMLPLSGGPQITVLGREVSLGIGVADLVAIESEGRVVIVETKLSKNSEARRAVVAQILTYAAFLQGLARSEFDSLLLKHLTKNGFGSVVEAVEQSEDSGEFDKATFLDGLDRSLATGSFRLVLVLDEAPAELVQLVGYLESVTSGISIDLITVASYELANEQVLVPVRVDPDYNPVSLTPTSSPTKRKASQKEQRIDGSERWEQGISQADDEDQPRLRALLSWARDLEQNGLATLKTVVGVDREILLVWVPGDTAGLTTIWNDHGAYVSLFRTVFLRHAWESIEKIENLIGKKIGQGNTVRNPDEHLLEALAGAYKEAVTSDSDWNGRDYYVSFGQNDQRSWEEARDFGFVSAGGGAWYSNTIRQLKPGHRVFVFIPKERGVGGYVGVGEVSGEPVQANEFVVDVDGEKARYIDVTKSPNANQYEFDQDMAEWIVPVDWISTRDGDDAVWDPDLFANQNSAAKLKHRYTLETIKREFGIQD